MVHCIIFDMDGTLIDSEPIWRMAEIAALNKVGIKVTEQMLAEQTAGMRNDEVVQYWFNQFNYTKLENAKTVQKAILDKVIELINADGNKRALEGIDYIFNFFETRNIPMALASSSPSKIINATLKAIGIEDKFIVKHSAEHENLGKPNPSVFITTAKLMNVKAENCLVFEDSLNGTLAAKAAKMKCVSIPAAHDYIRPEFAIADLKLKSLLEFGEKEFKIF